MTYIEHPAGDILSYTTFLWVTFFTEPNIHYTSHTIIGVKWYLQDVTTMNRENNQSQIKHI